MLKIFQLFSAALVFGAIVCFPPLLAEAQEGPLPPGIQNQGMFVRIYSVDGTVNPNHMDLETEVRPGQVVRLSADLYDQDHQQSRQGRRDFIWSIGDGHDCDLSQGICPQESVFRPTSDGVVLFVPQNMGDRLTVTATSPDPVAADAQGKLGSDSIVLRNLN
jgi:hypothetical protein